MTGEGQTISYLNQRVWYRLLKVLFVLAYAGTSLAGAGILYINHAPAQKRVDNQKTVIVCYAGNRREHIAAENGIHFEAADLEVNYLPDHFRVGLRELCAVTEQEIEAGLQQIIDGNRSSNGKLFEIKPSYIEEGGFWTFAKGAVLWLVGVTTAFEIMRRSFYYIALGRIFPRS